MSFRIEQSFELQAPVDRSWSYLVDPRQVVNCLPGAELLEVKGDQTFRTGQGEGRPGECRI